MTTIGASLLKVGSGRLDSLLMDLVASAVFWVGLFAAALGILSIFRSREYDRVTVFKKAQLERFWATTSRFSPTVECTPRWRSAPLVACERRASLPSDSMLVDYFPGGQ